MGHLILTPDPQGRSRGPRGTPRGQGHTKFYSPNQQMLQIDVVTYALVMTKMCSASSPNPWPLEALAGPKGPGAVTPKVNQMKKCYINFIAYASVITKMHLGCPPPPAPRGFTPR